MYKNNLSQSLGIFSKGQTCSEKTSVYFEHKGTLIFQTYKIRIYKKAYFSRFLNHPIGLANERGGFLHNRFQPFFRLSSPLARTYILYIYTPAHHSENASFRLLNTHSPQLLHYEYSSRSSPDRYTNFL